MQIKVVIMPIICLSLVSISDFANAENAPWECMGPTASCVSNKKTHKIFKYKKRETSKSETTISSSRTGENNTGVPQSSKDGSYGGSFGMASYYWQPQRLASGGVFNPNALTAAHKTLPFGTRVLVTNKRNGRSVTVIINDRGPFVKGRIIDLSKAAALEIGMISSGVAPVSVSVLD